MASTRMLVSLVTGAVSGIRRTRWSNSGRGARRGPTGGGFIAGPRRPAVATAQQRAPRSTRRIVGTAARCNGPLGYRLAPRIAGPAQGCPLHRARKLQGSPATPTMPPLEHAPHVWARLRVDTNCALRRGAWYRVLRLTRDQAVLQVTRERV